jgi:hypothetical protein
MAQVRRSACCVRVTAVTPVRIVNLVVPLAHEATAMRITGTTGSSLQARRSCTAEDSGVRRG